MTTEVQLTKIQETLEKVSAKQNEYEKLYLTKNYAGINAQEQVTASNSIIAGDVGAQGHHLQEISDLIAKIKAEVNSLSDKMDKIERKADDLEQYSRSNCLILHGSKQVPDDCEQHVLDTLNARMSLPITLTSMDIDICHTLPSKKGKNPIIIKFVRRTVRNTIFNHKRDFKKDNSTADRLSITESLTKRRLQLVEAARMAFNFNNVWTINGNVFCNFNGHKHPIAEFKDIHNIKSS